MNGKLSLRWRLTLVSSSLAFLLATLLVALLTWRSRNQLLTQLERSLESKCDEIITLLEDDAPLAMLRDFLRIETTYRFTTSTYYYELRRPGGSTMLRSANLNDELPLPESWTATDSTSVDVRRVATPGVQGGEPILVRTERVFVPGNSRDFEPFVIQTAVSLESFNASVRDAVWDAAAIGATSLVAVIALLWLVTKRTLAPVSEMTKKAAEIGAMNVRERLAVSDRGDELDELATVLNGMLDRLTDSLEQMEHFSSDASHQLRTPLTRIQGEVDLLLGEDLDSAVRTQLERVHEELERLSRLCERLLLLAQLDRRAADSSDFDDTVNIPELAGELIEQMTPWAKERGVELQLQDTRVASLRANRSLLAEALLNLLDNAIRATPKGGRVIASIAAKGPWLTFSVVDEGPGIAVEERVRIFQRFYQGAAAASKTSPDGYGLGLAIVTGIAKAHGGHVELEEGNERGSVFRLVLPADEVAALASQ